MDWYISLMGAETFAGSLITTAAIIGALTAIYVFIKKAVTKVRAARNRFDKVYDSVVGSGPIIDPETNRVIKEANIPIGQRMANVENTMERIVDVLERISAIDESQQKSEERFAKWLERHDEDTQSEHDKIWTAIRKLSPYEPSE